MRGRMKTQKRKTAMRRQGLECRCHKVRDAYSCQKLKEARKHVSLEALEGTWLCQHREFGLPAFRTVRDYISIVLNHRLVVFCYSSPGKWIHCPTVYSLSLSMARRSLTPGSLASHIYCALTQHMAPLPGGHRGATQKHCWGPTGGGSWTASSAGS